MRLLAVNTSNKIASVAVFEDGNLLGEINTEDQKTHSEKIIPSVDTLLNKLKLNIKDIDLFAVSVGPGSFTGIRIGVSLIKGMAQALNKKVIGVTSLEGLIEMAEGENVCAIINARHGNVYYQIKLNGNLLAPDCKQIEQVINELNGFNEKFIIAGDATEEFKDLFNFTEKYIIFDKMLETSTDIGNFAWKEYFRNTDVAKNPHEIVPIYLRKAEPDRGA